MTVPSVDPCGNSFRVVAAYKKRYRQALARLETLASQAAAHGISINLAAEMRDIRSKYGDRA